MTSSESRLDGGAMEERVGLGDGDDELLEVTPKTLRLRNKIALRLRRINNWKRA